MTLSSSTSFERGALRGATSDDLDIEAARAYLSRRAPSLVERLPFEQVLERVGLAARTGSSFCPTVAGVLLFGHLPQLLRPEWGLAAVRIDGRVLSDPVAVREDIEGTIPTMIEAALDFVGRHTQSLPNQVEQGERAEEYPRPAVREALVNALVHRDWGLTGRTALRIFDDRLELWSPGGPLTVLPPSLEELSGEGGLSLPRNPLIASTCRALGLGEQLGRGLPTMRRAVAEVTGEALTIDASKVEVCVTLPSALHARRRIS